jgi:hypothetical protein
MQVCPNCGVKLIAQVDVCFICGTLFSPPVPIGQSERVCPACGKRYPANHPDPFCTCGIELVAWPAPALASPVAANGRNDEGITPAAGILIVVGQDRRPVHTFSLTKDVTLIGRLDAVQGCFPDIDVDAWVEPALARKVSRRHALILHTRANDSFRLRPLGGNTGTQIEADMVQAMVDYPLTAGTRFILGGAVRFKFESM